MKGLLIAFCFIPAMLWSQDEMGYVPHADMKNSWRISSFDVNAGYRWYRKNISRVQAQALVQNPAFSYRWNEMHEGDCGCFRTSVKRKC